VATEPLRSEPDAVRTDGTNAGPDALLLTDEIRPVSRFSFLVSRSKGF